MARTHEELVERILHAGLAYSENVDPRDVDGDLQRAPAPARARDTPRRELGVPVVSDGEFMDNVSHVIGGTGIEEFADATADGVQFALF